MDQGAIATFKAYYLRRTFRQLIAETNDETSIKKNWKNYSITDAVDNIGESWKEMKSTTMNQIWKKIWPECIQSHEEVESLSKIRENILNLANDIGFENMEESDLIDLLDADREHLSNEELIQLEPAQANTIEESKPIKSKQLTSNDLSRALSHFEQGINILQLSDPDEERIAKVSRGINIAINCYKELKREAINKANQSTLDKFFQPNPSTSTRADCNDSSCSSFYSDI